jgi:site-specific DNA-cytosine methylase
VRAIDCLGFAGGFTLGIVQAGFELVGKREMKGGFGVPNCEANRHLLGHNWQSQTTDPTQWEPLGADVVFGNPPCSGFSGMSAKHFRGAHSPINHCMWAFVDYVARVRPTVAVFESVQLAFTRPDGLELMRALRTRLEEKTGYDWTLHHVLHNAYSIGACSQRRRYFWIASRVPFGIEWPIPQSESLPVLDDAIGDLEGLSETWESQALHSYPSHWVRPRTRPDVHVDGHISIRNPLTQRVVDLLAKVDWRPGEHLAVVAKRYHQQEGRLPDSWQVTEQKVVTSDFRLGYNTPVRWRADDAARVVTGAALFTALHPRLPRMLTHREIARIMGFPDTWLIEPLRNVPGLPATWGKGITVDCGRWIGYWIKKALAGSPGSFTGSPIGDREFLIDVTDAWKTSVVQSDSTLRKFRKLLSGERGIMTDPNVAPEVPQVENAAPADATETAKSGKGRPRPQATIELDERGYEAIVAAGDAGHTKETLATALDIEPSKAYLVLYRLRVTKRVHKERVDGSYKWKAGASPAGAAPESTPESEPAIPAEVPVAI